ncbi:unnamed protein product [Lota lota]
MSDYMCPVTEHLAQSPENNNPECLRFHAAHIPPMHLNYRPKVEAAAGEMMVVEVGKAAGGEVGERRFLHCKHCDPQLCVRYCGSSEKPPPPTTEYIF